MRDLLRHFRRATVAAVALFLPDAQAHGGNVVFGFGGFVPQPAAPPPVREGPPALLWAPPPVIEPSRPPHPPPAPRCYAGEKVCPLGGPVQLGEACSCPGGAGGRALIPPSRDTGGRSRSVP
jgi:hypothetical protein